MDTVSEFCDRAILIEDSRLLAQGSAEDVAARYKALFNPQPATAPPVQGKLRSSGASRYSEVTVPALLAEEGSLTLELEAVAEQDFDEPVYGFLIKSSTGVSILGANSLLKRQPTPSLKKGERMRLTWSVPNVFSDGLHHVDLAIVDRQGLAMYDY